MKLFKTQDISLIDRYTIEHEPISSVNLMERAASIWTKTFLQKYPNHNVTIVAGRGNNGGDGFVIARLLGIHKANVYLIPGSHPLSPDCQINLSGWINLGGSIHELNNINDFIVPDDNIIIDAMFGSGLNRAITGDTADLIRKINQLPNIVVSVDIPSGLMGEDNSNNDTTAIIQADATFTFQQPKIAFLLPENEKYVGDWQSLDIKLHPFALENTPTDYFMLDSDVSLLLPPTKRFAHKGTNGHGVLIAGSLGMIGAAQLAARAALRSGIGLLSCHIPICGRDIIQISVPEALADADSNQEHFSAVTLPSKCTAVAIGPGLGKHPDTVIALKDLLTTWHGTTIIDADAINIIAANPNLQSLLHENCILTPHIGEFERLVGKSKNDFERLNNLLNFAHGHKVHILLKGAFTAIATPNGNLYFNPTGNPGMAKGGMGDVLTGTMLALAANGLAPLSVAQLGVYAHGIAGDIAKEKYGIRGLNAGDVADSLAYAWQKMIN